MNNKFKDIKTFVRKLVDRGLFHVFGSSVINKIIAFYLTQYLSGLFHEKTMGLYLCANYLVLLFY